LTAGFVVDVDRVNSGGKNAIVLETATCGTVLERRRGHVRRDECEGFCMEYRQYNLSNARLTGALSGKTMIKAYTVFVAGQCVSAARRTRGPSRVRKPTTKSSRGGRGGVGPAPYRAGPQPPKKRELSSLDKSASPASAARSSPNSSVPKGARIAEAVPLLAAQQECKAAQ
jgi:hypothetical protein